MQHSEVIQLTHQALWLVLLLTGGTSKLISISSYGESLRHDGVLPSLPGLFGLPGRNLRPGSQAAAANASRSRPAPSCDGSSVRVSSANV